MFSLKACHMSILLLLAICMAFAQCAAIESPAADAYATDAIDDKNEAGIQQQLHKRPSFFVGSRYGRSGSSSPLLFAPSKARRLNMVPRNDRFFLGSRYGKRSGEYVSPYEQASESEAPTGVAAAATRLSTFGSNKSVNGFVDAGNGNAYMMSCIYAGLRNLYRCTSVEEINNIINQLTIAQNDDDKRK